MVSSEILAHFVPRIIGREIQVHQSMTSTNDYVTGLGKSGSPEGVVVFAEAQTAGRGRLGRHWQSAPGLGLWFSVLLRPGWPDYSRLSLAAAVAVARGIEEVCQQSVGIKWPNDLWLSNKKIAGILCEASGDFVVVGIGLNVNHHLEDFASEISDLAISLAIATGQKFDRSALAAAILTAFDNLYAKLPGAFPEVIAECEQRSVLQGKRVRIEAGLEFDEGVVIGVDSGGGLRVQTSTGLRIITSGEVTALKF